MMKRLLFYIKAPATLSALVMSIVFAATCTLYAPDYVAGGIIGTDGGGDVDQKNTVYEKLVAVTVLMDEDAPQHNETLVSCCQHIMGDGQSNGIIGSDSGGDVDKEVSIMKKLQAAIKCFDDTTKPAPADFMEAMHNIQGDPRAATPTYGVIGNVESKSEDTAGKLTDTVALLHAALEDVWGKGKPKYNQPHYKR